MFEDELQKSIFSKNTEKTFIDKLLARNEAERLKELVVKPQLTRAELLEILYMCSSIEIKMVNFGDWERYINAKFFVWIREFVKIAELMYDYKDNLALDVKANKIELSPRTQRLLLNNERLIEHNIKFLVDLYLNLMRSTLSLGATGFLELLKNKFEVSYPQMQSATPIENTAPRWSLTGGKK